ncbi:MAG: glutamine-hydrolyzing carbamoyl-phosphate synthase small subunit [Chloroflexi bacterium]|nr:glutamine-hydrolyzing carbamoyl-phosphate synthase small subunit [Chloroflexota bacterium]
MPARPALLVLEDGTVFRGESFGADVASTGEVVFSTAMTGYQEMLTDPSFAGQVLVLTYPMAGNYGINAEDVESKRIQVAGLVVHEACDAPSHWRSERTLGEYLASENVPGIAGVDTRALTRKLRDGGVMMGAMTSDEAPEQALARLRSAPRYGEVDLVRGVSTDEPYEWDASASNVRLKPDPQKGSPSKAGLQPGDLRHVVVVDDGVKYNIMRLLAERGCRVTALPPDADAETILALSPDGILFSPGPGDPKFLDYQVATVRSLIGKAPILGICLGHQVLGRAFGAETFKLKFGHRGANHPVQDVATGRVHITAQNHGYAVDPDGLSSDIEVSQVHLNDGTCEGLRHRSEPVISIQYHSEASPGPLDNVYVFDRFVEMMDAVKSG